MLLRPKPLPGPETPVELRAQPHTLPEAVRDRGQVERSIEFKGMNQTLWQYLMCERKRALGHSVCLFEGLVHTCRQYEQSNRGNVTHPIRRC
jgi:hypothetical protein